MFYDTINGLLRVLVIGPVTYAWLIAVLRVTGKRTLAQLNAFDFIVTVALGSTLATVVLSSTVAWVEGALALALLAVLQFIVAVISVHISWVRRMLTSKPTVLLRDGNPIQDALLRERISHDSLLAAVRGAGVGGLEMVSVVVLETNGKLSVISAQQLGSGSAVGAG